MMEIRKLIAIWAMQFAFWMLPDGKFKTDFTMFLLNNMDSL